MTVLKIFFFFRLDRVVIIKNLLQLLSLFRHFYDHVLELLAQSEYELPYYRVCWLQCMEIAVWPLLYVKKECNEINLSGQESCRKSQITKKWKIVCWD